MWIFVLEALIALSLLLFIVWWTLGPAQKRDREMMRRLADEQADVARAARQAATDATATNSPESSRGPLR